MNAFDWIGFSGLLIALAGWLYTWFVDRKVKVQQIALYQIQMKNLKENEDSSKQAIIEANVYRTPPNQYRSSGWRMKVYNKGQATARNIRIDLMDLGEDSHVKLIIPDELLPYPFLHPQNSFEIRMAVHTNNQTPRIKFIWDDDYGSNREREQILNL